MRSVPRWVVVLLTGSLLLVGCDGLSMLAGKPSNVAEPTAKKLNGLSGQVLGLNGDPAAKVLVRGHLVGNNSAGIIGNNSSSLISNNASSYRVQGLETWTDAEGHFNLPVSDGQDLNVEAVLSDNVKAIQLNVTKGAAPFTLQLAYTGSIRGRVTPPHAGITDLLGTDVFIPGTGYLAKTDQQGLYEIPYIPPGKFTLAATHQDLGRAFLEGVEVRSKKVTSAPDLALSTKMPTLSSVAPDNGAPGQTIVLRGESFGASLGKRPEVLINGLAAQVIEASDTVIKALVPNGAVSGSLKVKVGSLESADLRFAVLQRLDIFPDYMEDPLGNAEVPLGDVLAVGVARTYRVRGIDTQGKLIANPTVIWESSGSASVILEDGRLTASKAGTLTLSAQAGTLLNRTLAVEVVEAIEEVRVGPVPVPALNPIPDDPTLTEAEKAAIKDSVQLTAQVRLKGGAMRSLPMLWSTRDLRITVSKEGLVKAVRAAAEGTASVTVRTVADPAREVLVSVPIVHQGGMSFEIE